MKTLPSYVLALWIATAVFVVGCDDSTRKVKEQGTKLAEATKAKVQEVQWGKLFAEFESAGLNIQELAGLYVSNRWDEAKVWVSKIDSPSTRTVFQTVGEVLYLEEMDGVEGCKAKIDEWLKDKDIPKERRKTLEIMRAYVDGKSGRTTSDLAIVIGLTYLSYNGFDYAIDLHGGKMEVDKLVFIAAVDHARRTLRERTNRPPSSVK